MPLLIGALLAIAVGLMARVSGLDRDRAFYPTVLIVVASYFCLFAAMGGSTRALVLESLVALAFIAAALFGLRSSLWVVVAGLAAHGLSDFGHGNVIFNAGTPSWWPPFCASYDLVAAVILAWLIGSGRIRAEINRHD
jgi:hypothetical protein